MSRNTPKQKPEPKGRGRAAGRRQGGGRPSSTLENACRQLRGSKSEVKARKNTLKGRVERSGGFIVVGAVARERCDERRDDRADARYPIRVDRQVGRKLPERSDAQHWLSQTNLGIKRICILVVLHHDERRSRQPRHLTLKTHHLYKGSSM